MNPIQFAAQVTTVLVLVMSTGCTGTHGILPAEGHRTTSGRSLTLPAKPRAVELDPQKAALVVVDMQNDFGAKGGMLDRAGVDIAPIQRVIAPTARALAAARKVAIQIIYLKMAYRSDLSDLGPPDSPTRLRQQQFGFGKTITAPNGAPSRILIRDTWNTDILDELKPDAGDIVIYKNRYSGFYQTELDAILKKKGIRCLIFTGCTTSVCVESTIRDAVFRDYTSVLLADCTAEVIGADLPRSNHDASIFLIQSKFGPVSSSDAFIKAIETFSLSSR